MLNAHCLPSERGLKTATKSTGLVFFVLFFVAGLSLFASPVLAASELKFASVNLQQALAKSKAGIKAQKSYEAEVKKAQSDINEKKGEFESLRKSITKQRDSLKQEALAEKEEKLISLEKELKRSYRDAKEKLQRKNAVMVGELVKELRETVAKVGREGGYTTVLETGSQAVLYADSSIDITDKVIKAFNSRSSKK